MTPDTLEAYRSLADGRPADRARRRRAVVGPAPRAWSRSTTSSSSASAARGAAGSAPRTVKIMIDGVLENYTGALLEPYCDGCGGHDRRTTG